MKKIPIPSSSELFKRFDLPMIHFSCSNSKQNMLVLLKLSRLSRKNKAKTQTKLLVIFFSNTVQAKNSLKSKNNCQSLDEFTAYCNSNFLVHLGNCPWSTRFFCYRLDYPIILPLNNPPIRHKSHYLHSYQTLTHNHQDCHSSSKPRLAPQTTAFFFLIINTLHHFFNYLHHHFQKQSHGANLPTTFHLPIPFLTNLRNLAFQTTTHQPSN